MRTVSTVKVVPVVGEVMVPVSEGWPPPCGWKIVCGVMMAKSVEVPVLKSWRLGSARLGKGRIWVMVVLRLWSLALVWKVRVVLVAGTAMVRKRVVFYLLDGGCYGYGRPFIVFQTQFRQGRKKLLINADATFL
jgi:hypothetical protein